MKELLKKCRDRFISFLLDKLIETLFSTNILVVILRYLLQWDLSNKVLHVAYAIFCYFTLFLGVLLVFKILDYRKKQQLIKEEYIALNSGNNWDLLFNEMLILTVLIKQRNLKYFESQMINSNFITEYVEDIEQNCDPDAPVMSLLQSAYSRLEQVPFALSIINNLLNHKFIYQLPDRTFMYKVNDTIWNYEQQKIKRRKKIENKKQKIYERNFKNMGKNKLLYKKIDGNHNVYGFFGIRIKIKVRNK